MELTIWQFFLVCILYVVEAMAVGALIQLLTVYMIYRAGQYARKMMDKRRGQ